MKASAVFCCGALLLVQAVGAWGCGVCIEDKVAATYDHPVVQRASARGATVVFCELSGPIDAARIRSAARRLRGLDVASVRVSANPAALSFALDTKQQSPQAAAAALQQAVPPGTRVKLLKLIGPSLH
jgi:hypothetical protein